VPTPESGPSEHAVPTGATTEAERPTDQLVSRDAELVTPAGRLAYTATTGRLVLREEVHEDGVFRGQQARAELFVTSYVATGVPPGTRPVTFAFNGGPGSSSAWLHLGLLGPRRILAGDAGAPEPPPWRLADNAESLLAQSDLVFIDPVSTGFSRVVEGSKPAEYHGFRRDLDSIGELIRLWTTRNDRWGSPKFLIGESYGTIRAAALARELHERFGMDVNGIMLVSSVLDLATVDFFEGNELPYSLFLPTYASLAHYHGVTASDQAVHEVRAAAEELADRDYPWALARGARLGPAARASLVERLAVLTGLAPRYLERVDLRVEDQRFFAELLRDRGLVIGRLDGRFVGTEADQAAERPSHDPSYDALAGPYAAGINDYLRRELGYRQDLPYELLTARVQPWSYAEFEGRSVSVASSLATALRVLPHLRVYVASGYYDAATPYHAAAYVLAHLAVPPERRAQIEVHPYEAGHMMYVHEPSRRAQSEHLAAFVTAATPGTDQSARPVS